jgi:hypothetical protein
MDDAELIVSIQLSDGRVFFAKARSLHLSDIELADAASGCDCPKRFVNRNTIRDALRTMTSLEVAGRC